MSGRADSSHSRWSNLQAARGCNPHPKGDKSQIEERAAISPSIADRIKKATLID
jgi:hypothetical protein